MPSLAGLKENANGVTLAARLLLKAYSPDRPTRTSGIDSAPVVPAPPSVNGLPTPRPPRNNMPAPKSPRTEILGATPYVPPTLANRLVIEAEPSIVPADHGTGVKPKPTPASITSFSLMAIGYPAVIASATWMGTSS